MDDGRERRAFALLNKRTGDVFESYRICVLGDTESMNFSKGAQYVVGLIRHDGWILYHPDMSDFPIFFNLFTIKKYFVNLGDI